MSHPKNHPYLHLAHFDACNLQKSVEAKSFINSTCCKTKGGLFKTPKPRLKPSNNGIPSWRIYVQRPSNPWILIFEFPDIAELCWIWTSPISPRTLPISTGFMPLCCVISSLPRLSTFCGEFLIFYWVLEEATIATSCVSFSFFIVSDLCCAPTSKVQRIAAELTIFFIAKICIAKSYQRKNRFYIFQPK